jgi:hypothetical protein
VPGHQAASAGALKLQVFALPAAAVAARARSPVPIAAVHRGKESWNLVLGDGTARLVPWLQAPTEHYGFGAVVPPAAAATTSGTVAATAREGAAAAVVALLACRSQRGELQLDVVVGSETLRIAVPEPKPRG